MKYTYNVECWLSQYDGEEAFEDWGKEYTNHIYVQFNVSPAFYDDFKTLVCTSIDAWDSNRSDLCLAEYLNGVLLDARFPLEYNLIYPSDYYDTHELDEDWHDTEHIHTM